MLNKNVKIKAIGYYLPTDKIANIDTAKKNGYDENFVEKKIGFKNLLRKKTNDTVEGFCIKAYENLKRYYRNI